LKKLGAEVKLCGPKSLIPKHIESLGVSLSTDLIQTLKWCDAVNMLRVQNERMDLNYFPSNREYAQLYGLNAKKLKSLKKDIIILHPGPINRGVEVTSDVADSKNAIILDQVENGVAIRMAVIYLLAAKLNISSK
jgi:aspartate carbamoyltransferase catalytic subunit